MQKWDFHVAEDFALIQVPKYHQTVHGDNVVSNFWLVRSFVFQHYSKINANFAPENVFQVGTEECKANLIFFCALREISPVILFFAVVVFFLKEMFMASTLSILEGWRLGSS